MESPRRAIDRARYSFWVTGRGGEPLHGGAAPSNLGIPPPLRGGMLPFFGKIPATGWYSSQEGQQGARVGATPKEGLLLLRSFFFVKVALPPKGGPATSAKKKMKKKLIKILIHVASKLNQM